MFPQTDRGKFSQKKKKKKKKLKIRLPRGLGPPTLASSALGPWPFFPSSSPGKLRRRRKVDGVPGGTKGGGVP